MLKCCDIVQNVIVLNWRTSFKVVTIVITCIDLNVLAIFNFNLYWFLNYDDCRTDFSKQD